MGDKVYEIEGLDNECTDVVLAVVVEDYTQGGVVDEVLDVVVGQGSFDYVVAGIHAGQREGLCVGIEEGMT